MTQKIAIIGDVHGCIDEFSELFEILKSQSIAQIFHLGDLIDRGPDSAAVVRFCRENQVRGVMGNHESSLLALYERSFSPRFDQNQLSIEKLARWRILKSLQAADLDYLRKLPKLHVVEEMQTVLVHGGLWPNRAIWQQDRSILYLQLINPARPGEVRWTAKAGEYTLAESRAQGFSPWQELYDGTEQVVYGHTVYDEPEQQGNTIGIDTGCVFGGKLTAVILPELQFVSVPARRKYVDRKPGYAS